jgi:hypothetical protein
MPLLPKLLLNATLGPTAPQEIPPGETQEPTRWKTIGTSLLTRKVEARAFPGQLSPTVELSRLNGALAPDRPTTIAPNRLFHKGQDADEEVTKAVMTENTTEIVPAEINSYWETHPRAAKDAQTRKTAKTVIKVQ